MQRNIGTQTSFIPKKLEIEDRPELSRFPYNVMFSSVTIRDGVLVIGYAVYEPDFETYRETKKKQKMTYYNKYCKHCWLRIEYSKERESYMGWKYIGKKSAGGGLGSTWQGFFIHLTALGLVNGEGCEFTSLRE